ncbi:MAG: lysophospholipid acyltransferase family protein [Candidatus Omnitrophica bacterium]|nr:lysophospholipid acyltransferase family protein [Candidatus Omnitrophota bacterium]MCM8827991.1 lysophospholipid acyltransferase family protein [Candidatus Omnitrophota bacterium]
MEYLIYRFFCFLGIHLPDWLAYFIGDIMARLKYWFSPVLRKIITENIKQVLLYKQKIDNIEFNEKILKKTVKEVYKNFGIYMVEFFQIPKWDKKLVEEKVELVNLHYLDRALSRSKGAVVLTAHLGNWELAGVVTSLIGYNLSAVALPFKNEKIALIFIRRRRSKGINVILTGANPKEYLRAFKNNHVIAILGDRLFTEKGINVKFMGRETYLPRGPAALAARSGAVYLAGFLIRKKKGKYMLVFDKPMEVDGSMEQQDQVQSFVEQGARYLEKYILKYPDQWLNFSRMWSSE